MVSFHQDTPRLLDLFCCQGGASEGYRRAGFDIIGVDNKPQPRYPFRDFTISDALHYLEDSLDWLRGGGPLRFDAIHASPPCQAHSKTQRIRKNDHPELIEPLRDLLEQTGLPYVIENVPGSPLRNPIELCGAMFGLRLYRHRWFETNWWLTAPLHAQHVAPQVKMGRQPKPHEFIQPVGNFTDVDLARAVMEMPWATREGLREAIPPAYTGWIGRQLHEHLLFGQMTEVA